MGKPISKDQAQSILQSAIYYNQHSRNHNLAHYRKEIQLRLDLLLNNYFGPENKIVTEDLFSDDINLGLPAPLFGRSATQLDPEIRDQMYFNNIGTKEELPLHIGYSPGVDKLIEEELRGNEE